MTPTPRDRRWPRTAALVFALLAMVAGTVLSPTAGDAQAEPAPYRASEYRMKIGHGYSKTRWHRELGSDNWAVTWQNARTQLATFGDGDGFSANGRKCSAGISRLTTDTTIWNRRGINQWNGVDVACDLTTNGLNPGKSYGILATNKGGTLYMWHSPNSIRSQGADNFDSAQLLVSNDSGRNWRSTGVRFTMAEHKLGLPTFLQFGPGYSGYPSQTFGTKDGKPYVYMYFVGLTNKLRGGPGIETAIQDSARLAYSGGTGGQIFMARVPIDKLRQQSEYEWFANFNRADRPIFTRNFNARKPVFEDPNGVGWTVSAAYNHGLKKVMLVTEHSKSATGRLGVFSSDAPWGSPDARRNERLRWGTVTYANLPTSGFFWNFSNRWTNPNGRRSTLLWSGTSDNDDRLKVSFVEFENRR